MLTELVCHSLARELMVCSTCCAQALVFLVHVQKSIVRRPRLCWFALLVVLILIRDTLALLSSARVLSTALLCRFCSAPQHQVRTLTPLPAQSAVALLPCCRCQQRHSPSQSLPTRMSSPPSPVLQRAAAWVFYPSLFLRPQHWGRQRGLQISGQALVGRSSAPT